MQQIGLEPDVILRNAAISAGIKATASGVMELLAAMQQSGLAPNAFTYSSVSTPTRFIAYTALFNTCGKGWLAE